MFTLADYTKTSTGIANQLPNNLVSNATRILEAANKVRSTIAAKGIDPKEVIISSGYRSKDLNKKVKGSPNSAHLTALAVDLDSTNHNKDIWDACLQLEFDLIIWELGTDERPNWVHLQLAPAGTEPRKRMQRMVVVKGKNTYLECDENGKII